MHTPQCREVKARTDAGPPYTIETENTLTGTRQHRKATPYDSLDAARESAVRQASGTRTFVRFNVLDRRGNVIETFQGGAGGHDTVRETPHVVADFNTLDDLIAHAARELGATHVLFVDDEIHLYFRRPDGAYEKAEVRQKDNYWHAQGPGSRVVVQRLPAGAKPISGAVRRRAAEAPRHGAPVDQSAADELVLFIENESDLSPDGPRGQGRDVLLNALRKWKKGTYDPKLAVKLFGYLVESGAKRYAKEFGDGERAWSTMFPPATRQEAARQLEESFRNSAKQGEYDRIDVRPGSASRGITRAVRDYIAVDRRGKTIAGPFKTYGPAKDAAGTAGTVQYVRAGVGEVQEAHGGGRTSKQLIEVIREHVKLYRDPKTGIAWVEDGTTGMGHSSHPNISATGSITGMRKRGYWGKNDRVVRSHGFLYNIDLSVISGELDRIACEACRCDGVHNCRHELQASKAKRRRAGVSDPIELAKRAGAAYANDQITGDYFMDWVREQMHEAHRMDPSTRLPLETKADALVIARNMFQDLEWDTKRQLDDREIARLIDGDATRENTSAFYKGFKETLQSSRDWLADELLEIKQELEGRRASESKRRAPKVRRSVQRRRR
jgi:hypothetical protein